MDLTFDALINEISLSKIGVFLSDALDREQDMREVGVTMSAWEYRMRWYGEDEPTARTRAAEVGEKPAPVD